MLRPFADRATSASVLAIMLQFQISLAAAADHEIVNTPPGERIVSGYPWHCGAGLGCSQINRLSSESVTEPNTQDYLQRGEVSLHECQPEVAKKHFDLALRCNRRSFDALHLRGVAQGQVASLLQTSGIDKATRNGVEPPDESPRCVPQAGGVIKRKQKPPSQPRDDEKLKEESSRRLNLLTEGNRLYQRAIRDVSEALRLAREPPCASDLWMLYATRAVLWHRRAELLETVKSVMPDNQAALADRIRREDGATTANCLRRSLESFTTSLQLNPRGRLDSCRHGRSDKIEDWLIKVRNEIASGKPSEMTPDANCAAGEEQRSNVEEEPADAYVTEDIEGWTVLVNNSFRCREPQLCTKTLEALRWQLYLVARNVPPLSVEKLRTLPIWVEEAERDYPCMRYYPSQAWLVQHRMNPDKARSIELANARNFLAWSRNQPWIVFHELAHGYHHQFLEGGFDNADIRAAYRYVVERRVYEAVLRASGRRERHYALTNPIEYFAESSEAYFGTNDFYPFVRSELRAADPMGSELLRKMWGE